MPEQLANEVDRLLAQALQPQSGGRPSRAYVQSLSSDEVERRLEDAGLGGLAAAVSSGMPAFRDHSSAFVPVPTPPAEVSFELVSEPTVTSVVSTASSTPAPVPAPVLITSPATASAVPAEISFQAFLSHDWGTDASGRDTHARVVAVAEALKSAGLATWLDEEQMRGNVNEKMAEGIEDSATIVCFLTERYLNKASGRGPNGQDDNCKFEFDLALTSQHLGVEKMIPVILERQLASPVSWPHGTVKGKLAGKLYIDLSSDLGDPAFSLSCQRLEKEIRELSGAVASRARSQSHPQGPVPESLALGNTAPTVVTLSAEPYEQQPTSLAEDDEQCTFWFVQAKFIRELPDGDSVPALQELLKRSDWMVQRSINLFDCLTGEYREEFLFVSHRWETPEVPDPKCTQLEAVCKHLRNNQQIQYAWMDFWCM